jgi:hypothetical protein
VTPWCCGPAPGSGSATALLAALPAGSRVGTGSIRRVAQLRRWAPAARFESIRGNVDTRLRKLDEGAYDALVLAAAGLRRLGLADRISAALPPDTCVPAPGQGVVVVEVRARTRPRGGPCNRFTTRRRPSRCRPSGQSCPPLGAAVSSRSGRSPRCAGRCWNCRRSCVRRMAAAWSGHEPPGPSSRPTPLAIVWPPSSRRAVRARCSTSCACATGESVNDRHHCERAGATEPGSGAEPRYENERLGARGLRERARRGPGDDVLR